MIGRILIYFRLLMALIAAPAVAQQGDAKKIPPLMIEQQGSFFVGGRNVKSESLSTLPAFASSGTITVNQMYVRYQIPVDATRLPVVLIHGCCLTGKTWETTPDGRMGWDEYFVRKGHPTYVIDQVSRGRSAADPTALNSVKLGKTPPEQTPAVFSLGQESAWVIFRFGPKYPQIFPGMQFPLEAQIEFWKQMVPDWAATLPTPNPTVQALSELAIRLNGTILVSHSQSGIYPFQVEALDSKGIAGIIVIEPAACPAANGDLKPYLKVPTLILFGDYVDLSPRWTPRLEACREFVQEARKIGGKTTLVVLPEIGIKGNSHLLMQDHNSLEIADWLSAWIDANIEPQR